MLKPSVLRLAFVLGLSPLLLEGCRAVVRPAREAGAEVAAAEKPQSFIPIKDVTPQGHDLGPEWNTLKEGYLLAVAYLAAVYPEHEIYFLSRELEYMHDMSQLLLFADAKRFHILNIPLNKNENMGVVGLQAYLDREGLSQEALGRRRALFVDPTLDESLARIRAVLPAVAFNRIDILQIDPAFHLKNASLDAFLAADGSYDKGKRYSIYSDLMLKTIEIPKTLPELDHYKATSWSGVTAVLAARPSSTSVTGDISAYRSDLVAFSKVSYIHFTAIYNSWRTVASSLKTGPSLGQDALTDYIAGTFRWCNQAREISIAGAADLMSAANRGILNLSALGGVNSPVVRLPLPPAAPVLLDTSGTQENPSVYTNYVGRELRSGQYIKLASGHVYRIERYLNQGKRGRVYLMKRDGKQYVIKLPKYGDSETMDSFARESNKIVALASYNIPHAAIIERGEDYIVKDFIDGKMLKDFFEEWQRADMPKHDPMLVGLQDLLDKSVDRRVFIGDLNAKNLIWDGKKWVVIDSGGIEDSLSEKEIIEKYLDQLERRYGKIFFFMNAGTACKRILRRLNQRLDRL